MNTIENATPSQPICEHCGQSYAKKRHKAQRYCSMRCDRQRRRKQVERQCKYCGKSFVVKAYRRDTATYCSRACLAKVHLAQFADSRLQPGTKAPRRYKQITTPDGRYLRLHRWVMEQHLGRPLTSAEHVHHIDGNPNNNDVSNLCILTHGEHARIEVYERQKALALLAPRETSTP